MYPTAEVRWFYKGNIPSSVMSAYLTKGENPISQPPRIDYYFRLPDKDDLSIKIRQGALEIKQRIHDHGIHEFNSQAAGFITSWRKWHFDLAPFSLNIQDEVEASSHWVPIRKKRWLRRYSYTNSGDLTEVLEGIEITNGCEWELSEVQMDKSLDIWWSIAFESFGESGTLRNKLVDIVEKVFRGIGTKNYLAQDSRSYPCWLIFVNQNR